LTHTDRSAIYVQGASCSVFGRFTKPLVEEAGDVVRAALTDAQIEPAEVGALYVGNYAAQATEGQGGIASMIAGEAELAHAPATKVEGVCASGGIALRHAIQAIRAGEADVAVAVGVDGLTQAPREERTGIVSSALDQRIEGRLGMSFPAFFALAASDYIDRNWIAEQDLFAVVEHNLARGERNPVVSRPRRFDLDSYLRTPFVAEPLRVADSCPTTDGAAAVVVSNGRRNGNGNGRAVRVMACTQGTGSSSIADLDDLIGFEVVRRVAAAAYDTAGVTPDDVDVVEVHDAFSISQLVDLEDLGFFERGRGFEVLESQHALFVNPSGGLLSRGHPIAASGLAQVYELVRQLRGESHHQHPDATVGLAQSVGAIGGYATVTILSNAN
jgi:acetyl-CoA C-acetyltransferase